MFNKIKSGVVNAAASATTSAVKNTAIATKEAELKTLINGYEECYIIIGKRISESLRNGEENSDAKVNDAFKRILGFDDKRSELEDQIRELRGDKRGNSEAEDLLQVENEVEAEIKKCKELLDIGVDEQDDYDRKVATLQNRVTHFQKIRALDAALSKKLITEAVYNQKKVALLGEDING
jgi:hypothetical protein